MVPAVVTSSGRCGIVEVMQLRLVHSLRGKNLVRWICVIAVALASILHVDAAVAAPSPASSGLGISAPQDDDRAGDAQIASECCHFCSVPAFVSVAAPAIHEPGTPIVPSGRASPLASVEQQATAPPPRA